MDPLDKPVNLQYHNGKVFASNVVIVAYIVLGLSVVAFFTSIILGVALALISAFAAFTWNGVAIDPETKSIKDYTAYFGIFKLGKTIDYNKFAYITVIPTKQTATVYASVAQSTSYTDYYFSICLLNKNYRNKTEITKFPGKADSTQIARQLAHRMEMKFFEYDPKVIREKMLGR